MKRILTVFALLAALAAMLLVWLTPPDWRLRRARQAEGGHWNPETGICEHSA